MKSFITVLAFYFSFLPNVFAEPLSFSSGDKQVQVIELYTSEGCSSCPPAEKWLNSFKHDERLWNEVIPLAFHVDYWDYIGWPDRFAEAKYGDRQRYYAFSDQLNSVYTPGVMLNGREWRGWYRNKPIQQLDKTNGKLNLEVDGEEVNANFVTKDSGELLNINIAVLGFDLKTDVKRGENHGRELVHDFVVLGHKQVRMQSNDDQFSVSTVLPQLKEKADKLAVVAWVNKSKDLTPLQATGGWIAD